MTKFEVGKCYRIEHKTLGNIYAKVISINGTMDGQLINFRLLYTRSDGVSKNFSVLTKHLRNDVIIKEIDISEITLEMLGD